MDKELLESINCSNTPDSIPDNLIGNPKLSSNAKIILLILLSNKKGWDSYITSIEKMMKEGSVAIKSGIKELKTHNYLKKIKYGDKQTGIWKGNFIAYTTEPDTFNFTNVHNNSTYELMLEDGTSEDQMESISDNDLSDINIVFDKYISIASELRLIKDSFKLTKHKSIESKVSINNHTTSLSIKQLIFDALQIYDTDILIKCLDNYKLICLNESDYWYKPYWNSILILRAKSLPKLLDNNSLKNKKVDYYTKVRYQTEFLMLGEFNIKSPLNMEADTYMGIDTEIIKKRNVPEYFDNIESYIKIGVFERSVPYFQWVEECMACLIYRKSDETLLHKLVDIHNYWHRHFKLILKDQDLPF